MKGRNFLTTAVTVILCWVPLAEPFLPQAPLRPVAPDFATQRQHFSPFTPLQQPPRRLVTMSARKQGFFRRFRRNRGRTTEEAPSMEEHRTKQLNTSRNSRVARLRSYLKRSIFATSLAASLLLGTPRSAEAARSKEQTLSIRPGMTSEQLERGQNGEYKQVLEELEDSMLQRNNPREAKKKEKSKKVSAFEDYGDEQTLDDLLDEASATLSVAKQKELKKISKKMTEGAREAVGGYYETKAPRSLYIKIGVTFFAPTYGGLAIREFVRRRREARYMEKGLEILRAQKAEYFNITETASDADVEDELKGLKNETSSEDKDDEDDDEDDDADDDEDDDEDEPVPKRKPPGGPSGDGGGSGSGGDSGGGKPSDDDLDRLNKIFGKS